MIYAETLAPGLEALTEGQGVCFAESITRPAPSPALTRVGDSLAACIVTGELHRRTCWLLGKGFSVKQ